jgi:predicted small secreted protein
MTRCGQCGKHLCDGPDPEPRAPCSDCGSTHRVYDESIKETAKALDSVAFKQRRRGDGGYVAKGMSGYERSADGRLVKKDSIFDAEADRRFEHVEDAETGEVLHHGDHKLTEHTGHGSAKLKTKKAGKTAAKPRRTR